MKRSRICVIKRIRSPSVLFPRVPSRRWRGGGGGGGLVFFHCARLVAIFDGGCVTPRQRSGKIRKPTRIVPRDPFEKTVSRHVICYVTFLWTCSRAINGYVARSLYVMDRGLLLPLYTRILLVPWIIAREDRLFVLLRRDQDVVSALDRINIKNDRFEYLMNRSRGGWIYRVIEWIVSLFFSLLEFLVRFRKLREIFQIRSVQFSRIAICWDAKESREC